MNAAELKRIIEGLPLETSAVAAVEWRLGQLEPSQFAALLTELARDNHAFRHVPRISFPPLRCNLKLCKAMVLSLNFNVSTQQVLSCWRSCVQGLAAV